MIARTLGRPPRAVSPLGVELAAARPGTGPGAIERDLGRFVELGVTVFDVGSGPSAGVREGWVRRAVGGRERTAFVIAHHSSHPARVRASRASRAVPAAPAPEGVPSSRFDLMLVQATPDDPGGLRELVGRSDATFGIGAWALELPPSPAVREQLELAVGAGAGTVAMTVNLLDRALALPALGRCAEAGIGVIGLDPFSAGRLDGSRLTASPVERVEPPRSIGAMRRDYAPVLELGFLTSGTRRTLAEASVLFALAAPPVRTVLVGFPTPGALERWTRALEQDRLGPEDWTRLGRPPDPPSGG